MYCENAAFASARLRPFPLNPLKAFLQIRDNVVNMLRANGQTDGIGLNLLLP